MGTTPEGSYADVAKHIRDEVSFFSGSACQAQHRDDWPQLWSAIDELVTLVDRDHPRQAPGPSLFPTSDEPAAHWHE